MVNEQLSLAPVARNTSVESLIAAQKVDAKRQLEAVLLALYEADGDELTDDDLAERCGLLRTSAGTRRGVLVRMGLAVRAGRGLSALGNPCATWTLTEKGVEVARSLVRETA